MQPRTAAILTDAYRAAVQIRTYCDDKTWDEYQSDRMLRDAVERQFMILGEAFYRLRAHDPAAAVQIIDLPNIIGFRNVVVHGYDSIDDRLVWNNATTLLHPVIDALDLLLEEVG